MSSDRIIEEFDAWVEDGRSEGLEKGHGEVVGQVIEKMAIGPGEKVLDLGCGTGWATRLLAKTSAGVQAIGVDVSPKMIARADELHSLTIRARYDLGRFEELEFKDGEFDRIFSMEAIYYSPDLDACLRECFRVLKPGGTADLVLDYYRENPGTETWQDSIDVPMQWLGEAEWKERLEAVGFTGVEASRVIDARGPGAEADFVPSEAFPDWETRRAIREAGSLWLHAVRPG